MIKRLVAFFWNRGVVQVPVAIEENVTWHGNGSATIQRGRYTLPYDSTLEYLNARAMQTLVMRDAQGNLVNYSPIAQPNPAAENHIP